MILILLDLVFWGLYQTHFGRSFSIMHTERKRKGKMETGCRKACVLKYSWLTMKTKNSHAS